MIIQQPKSRRTLEVFIHIVGWGIVLGLPFLLMNRSGFNVSWVNYLRHGSAVPVSFIIIFYINYCWLIPHSLFNGKMQQYLILNILLILCTAGAIHLWQEYIFHAYRPVNMPKHPGPPSWIFILRDIFTMVLTVGLAVAIRLSGRWIETETARREAEKSRTEAELKNLRNQLNPHFLLNTLNNIYALIAFDSDKAQAAVRELSRLLRHVLYDNQQDYVTIDKEIDFIRNYIELMRIRLAANVEVETEININPNSRTEIAPLVFISLIENAFKHGISPTEPSFIHIAITEEADSICCDIINSYHPKNEDDKSGSGIGLEQVQKRLDLLYPGKYEWQKGVQKERAEYESKLTIHV